jgi:hypothetical protein
MLDKHVLEAIGFSRSEDTAGDTLDFFKALKASPQLLDNVIDSIKSADFPFYNLYANYGTGIGETVEEIVEDKFIDIISKTKQTKVIYEEFYRANNCKATNFDRLLEKDDKHFKIEIKVIRAASGKPKIKGKKYQAIPSLLEERALSFADISQSGNGSFQQTKAKEFDYILGVLVCKDQVNMYLVPSKDILDGTLKITNQHAGAILEDGSTNEGHLSLSDVMAGNYLIGEYKTEKELLTKAKLGVKIKL